MSSKCLSTGAEPPDAAIHRQLDARAASFIVLV
jgi:hypothetical protein